MKKLITAMMLVGCICLLFTGCQSQDTMGAGINGMTLTDINGRKWIAKHSVGDCFFLYETKDGKVNFEGK